MVNPLYGTENSSIIAVASLIAHHAAVLNLTIEAPVGNQSCGTGIHIADSILQLSLRTGNVPHTALAHATVEETGITSRAADGKAV